MGWICLFKFKGWNWLDSHQISQYVGGSCIRLWLRDVYFGFKWCLHLVKQVLETCILKPWKSAYKVCNLEILQILDFSSLGSYIYKEREIL